MLGAKFFFQVLKNLERSKLVVNILSDFSKRINSNGSYMQINLKSLFV